MSAVILRSWEYSSSIIYNSWFTLNNLTPLFTHLHSRFSPNSDHTHTHTKKRLSQSITSSWKHHTGRKAKNIEHANTPFQLHALIPRYERQKTQLTGIPPCKRHALILRYEKRKPRQLQSMGILQSCRRSNGQSCYILLQEWTLKANTGGRGKNKYTLTLSVLAVL